MTAIKEVVIVSGKGGTGKTSLAAALGSLFPDKVIADCDVDAANLHLILRADKVLATKEFTGGKKASINQDLCMHCGTCNDVCKYEAISADFIVDPVSCEGCGACFFLCPAHAVTFDPRLAGYCYTCSISGNGRFIYAELLPGEENSGKLVSMVREEARAEAEKTGKSIVLIDGPPGIGCPVISSLTGTRLAVIVTEPTPAGVHDLKRIVALSQHFGIKTALVVNKWDINRGYTEEIKKYCADNGLVFLGEIPYETAITRAQKEAKTILEYAPACAASGALGEIYTKLQSTLEEL
jgi:MinD superfamily P-loop ATPase